MSKKPIPFKPDASQLSRGIKHICYEYANLISAARWDMNGSPPWRTHADDAFLLGCRKMADFLLNPQRSRAKGAELPDVLALDYLPSGCIPSWTLPTWTGEWRDAMNRQLAHLSYDRDKEWVHDEWVPALEREFRVAWLAFLDAVDVKYKAAFDAEMRQCRQKEGLGEVAL